MRILVTNDDGYLAGGIQTLAAARVLGEVHVVAPDREQSATSHSLTMHYPLRVRWCARGAPRGRHAHGLRGAGGGRAAGASGRTSCSRA
jgi:5'/3'-nucleotidase SurE